MSDVVEYKAPFGPAQVREILPHRYPFLMIDRVTELEPGVSATAIKCVTHNEPWAPGHFPERAVMPGVLQIEAMAQTGAVILLVQPEHRGRSILLGGLKNVRLRRIIEPGDVLTIRCEMQSLRMGVGKAIASIEVEGEPAASAVIQFAIIDT